MTSEIITGLVVQIEVLKSEERAITEIFGGYETDRLMTLRHQIPILQQKLREYTHDTHE